MKPILFNSEMVRAIIAGRKTQTRRIMKPQPFDCTKMHMAMPIDCSYRTLPMDMYDTGGGHYACRNCGNGIVPDGSSIHKGLSVGDILYVRETWAPVASGFGSYIYKADYSEDATKERLDIKKWRPSIHMPAEAARLFLRITDVRVERLNEISEEDAIAEGIERTRPDGIFSYRSYAVKDGGSGVAPYVSFRTLWQSIEPLSRAVYYGDKKSIEPNPARWEANPWVWVYTFERIEKP